VCPAARDLYVEMRDRAKKAEHEVLELKQELAGWENLDTRGE
jgi:hypothetical protein